MEIVALFEWSLSNEEITPTATINDVKFKLYLRLKIKHTSAQDRDANRKTEVVDSAPQIPTALETSEEEEERLKKSFNNYLTMEKEFLVKLGLRKEDDPVELVH